VAQGLSFWSVFGLPDIESPLMGVLKARWAI